MLNIKKDMPQCWRRLIITSARLGYFRNPLYEQVLKSRLAHGKCLKKDITFDPLKDFKAGSFDCSELILSVKHLKEYKTAAAGNEEFSNDLIFSFLKETHSEFLQIKREVIEKEARR